MRDWNSQARNREARLARAAHLARGKQVQAGDAGALLEAVLEPGDRVCLEGNNQKQADFLASRTGCRRPRPGPRPAHGAVGAGAARTSRRVRARHRGASSTSPSPARKAARLARLVGRRPDRDRRHPHLSGAVRPLLRRSDAAASPGRGAGRRRRTATSTPAPTPRTRRPSSRRPPSSAASSSPRSTSWCDTVPRVDIPGDWVDFVVQSPRPHYIEPLFTRDPAQITEIQVLMAMMAIKGIYAEYGVQPPQPRHRLRHRGDRAAAADLRARRSA